MLDTSVSSDETGAPVVAPSGAATRGSPPRGPDAPALEWLLLTHRLPAEPAYLRVKVSRRLERIGSVALKNSVYVLPPGEDTLEDFQWLSREIALGGGETSLCRAVFLDGETDDRLVQAFRAARGAEYEAIVTAAEALHRELEDDVDGATQAQGRSRLSRLRTQLAAVRAIDFFEAEEGEAGERAVRAVEMALDDRASRPQAAPPPDTRPSGSTWVTRRGVKVDRIASAWLIARFIDPSPRFEFVPAQGYVPGEGELRFDMFDGEFTHVGDACTFETLIAHFELDDPALVAIGEIIHDIDVKDERFGRPEVPGVASLVRGITSRWDDDMERIRRGGDILDGLYEHFRA